MAVLRDVRTVVMFVVDVTERAAKITESSATAPLSNDASKNAAPKIE